MNSKADINTEDSKDAQLKEDCAPVSSNLLESIPVDEEVQDLSEFFRVLGDPTRLRILSILSEKPLCVHKISEALDMQQTAISHQLKILRHNRLVKYRKEGRHVFYSLKDSHIDEIISTGLEHIKEQ
ncbi:MAG: metalloregulator ArsR/SmtB family transcription factor [Spirochaetia bacterium]|jgi:ArsR family transcriptional regulator|nr:metalloregulator ArsR/SmtB family transcription factor [Spirochaetia bacterium]